MNKKIGLGILAVLVMVGFLVGESWAAIPQGVNIQGKLTPAPASLGKINYRIYYGGGNNSVIVMDNAPKYDPSNGVFNSVMDFSGIPVSILNPGDAGVIMTFYDAQGAQLKDAHGVNISIDQLFRSVPYAFLAQSAQSIEPPLIVKGDSTLGDNDKRSITNVIGSLSVDDSATVRGFLSVLPSPPTGSIVNQQFLDDYNSYLRGGAGAKTWADLKATPGYKSWFDKFPAEEKQVGQMLMYVPPDWAIAFKEQLSLDISKFVTGSDVDSKISAAVNPVKNDLANTRLDISSNYYNKTQVDQSFMTQAIGDDRYAKTDMSNVAAIDAGKLTNKLPALDGSLLTSVTAANADNAAKWGNNPANDFISNGLLVGSKVGGKVAAAIAADTATTATTANTAANAALADNATKWGNNPANDFISNGLLVGDKVGGKVAAASVADTAALATTALTATNASLADNATKWGNYLANDFISNGLLVGGKVGGKVAAAGVADAATTAKTADMATNAGSWGGFPAVDFFDNVANIKPSKIGYGIDAARITQGMLSEAQLPVISDAKLGSGINAAKLVGILPGLDGSALQKVNAVTAATAVKATTADDATKFGGNTFDLLFDAASKKAKGALTADSATTATIANNATKFNGVDFNTLFDPASNKAKTAMSADNAAAAIRAGSAAIADTATNAIQATRSEQWGTFSWVDYIDKNNGNLMPTRLAPGIATTKLTGLVTAISGNGLGTLATKNAVDWSGADIANKPALGALAGLNTVDWTSQIANKPNDLLQLSNATYFDPAKKLLNTQVAGLGALATKSTVNYDTDVTAKPVLGALAGKDNVGPAEIAASAVGANQIASGAVDASKLAVGAAVGNIDAGSITGDLLADLDASKITTGTLSSARIPALNIAKSAYAYGTVQSGALSGNSGNVSLSQVTTVNPSNGAVIFQNYRLTVTNMDSVAGVVVTPIASSPVVSTVSYSIVNKALVCDVYSFNLAGSKVAANFTFAVYR